MANSKDIWNTLTPQNRAAPQYGYQNPAMLMNNLPQPNQMAGQVINPMQRGFNGPLAIFDPKTQMGGHEANILGITRQQDI